MKPIKHIKRHSSEQFYIVKPARRINVHLCSCQVLCHCTRRKCGRYISSPQLRSLNGYFKKIIILSLSIVHVRLMLYTEKHRAPSTGDSSVLTGIELTIFLKSLLQVIRPTVTSPEYSINGRMEGRLRDSLTECNLSVDKFTL